MHQHMVQCSGMKSDSILTLQINRRMEFVFASHSFDAWESWAIEGPLEECRLINCRNPLVFFSFISFLKSFKFFPANALGKIVSSIWL